MDPRIARTQQSLQRALLELATEQPLDDITVADIADRAAVNRSTFYQHYSDKETLLADALDAVMEEAGTSLAEIRPSEEPPEALVQFLRHVVGHAELYRWAVGDHGSAVVTARLRRRVEALVRHHLAIATETTPFEGIPADLVAAGVAGSALGAIRAWLESEPLAPVEVASAWIWRLVRGPGTS